jgi:DNA-3-methyladenine glycosylase
MAKQLGRQFYLKPPLIIAKELLGKYLVHQTSHKKYVGKIVETEAYPGPQDLASHARHNKITPRNLAEYMIGGHIYIYLVYGMYWQLNISTGLSGRPECVLIRAIEPIEKNHIPTHLTNGPGKLCNYLRINRRHYGLDLATSREIWLEPGEKLLPKKIITAKRIGIDYAGPYWANKRWRFYIKNNHYVSKF